MFTASDREKCQKLFEQYYAGREFFDTRYRGLIKKYLRPGERVLDAGCGRYMKVCQELCDGGRQVFGIDMDSILETNNHIAPFGVRGDLTGLPFPAESFDMVISRSVVEHLESPVKVFREFHRVLRPGGKLVLVTPNKYDYVSLIAALTPYRLHRYVVSRILSVSEDDVFPTLYRANTLTSIRKALASAGLKKIELDTVSHYPAYLTFSPFLFRLGVLYERMTSLRAFRSLRGSILCIFEKPTALDCEGSRNRNASARMPAEVS